jgi:hypothetical protein
MIKEKMWESLLDDGRIAWQITLAKALNNLDIIGDNALSSFEAKWCRKGLLCNRYGTSMRWNLLPPPNVHIIW